MPPPNLKVVPPPLPPDESSYHGTISSTVSGVGAEYSNIPKIGALYRLYLQHVPKTNHPNLAESYAIFPAGVLHATKRSSARRKQQGSVSMSDTPTREEINAKLEAAEARSETRFTELSGKIDRITESIASFSASVSRELHAVHEQMVEVKRDNRETRWTIVVTVILAILAAIGALWVTQANLLAAFQTGISLRQESSPNPPASSLPPPAPPSTPAGR